MPTACATSRAIWSAAVGLGAGHVVGGDHARRARPVLDDDGGLAVLADGLRHQPGDLVGGAAGRVGHDEADRRVLGARGRGRQG
ncbi:hypothetical protein C1I89_03525 [Achromobacter pulmonis]|uniref:Uncharacterized protein n=1 Tax=Achromobacter pulmonis TaxID=1389932 RepID=A0A2N8KPS4_9BURK|nr:hypothetical protein C1I89_03525 [Achromobacter pulmonis]